MRKEIDIAEEMKKEIVPLLIRKTGIPKDMVYQLIGLQHIDLASDFILGVKRLIEALLLLDARGPTLVLLSPEARKELKRLIADRSSSPSDKMVELVALWAKELGRIGDLRLAEILALDDRPRNEWPCAITGIRPATNSKSICLSGKNERMSSDRNNFRNSMSRSISSIGW